MSDVAKKRHSIPETDGERQGIVRPSAKQNGKDESTNEKRVTSRTVNLNMHNTEK